MRLIARSTLLVALSGFPLFVSTSGAADDRTAFTKAIASSRIYGFLEILRNSGLPEESVNGAEVTLIIPIDTAFYTLTPERYTALLAPENKELAARYIRSHVISGRVTMKQLAAGGYKTLEGVAIKVTAGLKAEDVQINGCSAVLPDQAGSTGMFHLIDGFLFQP